MVKVGKNSNFFSFSIQSSQTSMIEEEGGGKSLIVKSIKMIRVFILVMKVKRGESELTESNFFLFREICVMNFLRMFGKVAK